MCAYSGLEAAAAADLRQALCLWAHAALVAQALDAFVLRSPHNARGALPQILPVVLQCLAHDPNCEDDMDAEDGSGGEEEEDECALAC